MIASLSFKDVSEDDLSTWGKHSSLGIVGATFFSKPFKTVDYPLLNFLFEKGNRVDTFFVLAHKNTLSEEELKILTLIPYVNFIYAKEGVEDFFEFLGCNHFFKLQDQDLPEKLKELIDSSEGCELHEN